MKTCSCSSVVASAGLWSISRNFQIITRTTKTHLKGCPLSKSSEQKQTHTLAVRTICAGRFLTKALEISSSLTHGAGGYSLASSIGLRTLLREDSPAFQLFDPVPWRLEREIRKIEEDEYLDHMKEALQKLKIWFSEGKASPNDINVNGRTILQVS